MCYFFSFAPATIWIIIGYFVLYSSAKTIGALQRFGQTLGVWTFIIAAFFPIMGTYVTFARLCPIQQILQPVPQ